jgi:O-antigen/teichoic acid export membrane protein
VSKYNALQDNDGVVSIVETTIITVAFTTAVMLGIIVLVVNYFSNGFFNESELSILSSILPLVVTAFFVAILGRVHLSVLDGLNQLHHRSYIGIISKLVFIVISILTISRLGLKGLAIANLAQYLASFILTSIYIKLYHKEISIFFPSFKMKYFKEIFKYGFNFQISSIFQAFIDPSVKFYLTSYGGMALVGIFEVAYKYFTQIRQLVVVAVYAMVPTIANRQELNPDKIKSLFLKVLSTLAFTSTALFLLAFSGMPLYLHLIRLESTLTITGFSIIIYAGLLANLIGLAPFIFNVGTGDLKMNTISSGVLALTCSLLAFGLGTVWGGYGVVLGWTIAQCIASSLLLFKYLGKDQRLRKEVLKQGAMILVLNVFFLTTMLIVLNSINFNMFLEIIIGVLISILYSCLAVFIIPGFEKYKNYMGSFIAHVTNNYAKR